MWNEICDVYSPDAEKSNWRHQFEKVSQCKQRQDSTNEQLKDLIEVANRLGFYDASDYLKNILS